MDASGHSLGGRGAEMETGVSTAVLCRLWATLGRNPLVGEHSGGGRLASGCFVPQAPHKEYASLGPVHRGPHLTQCEVTRAGQKVAGSTLFSFIMTIYFHLYLSPVLARWRRQISKKRKK